MYNKRKFNLFKMYNLKYNKNNIKSFMFNIITIAVGLAVFFAIQVVNLVNKNEIEDIAYKKVGADIGITFNDNIIDENQYNTLETMRKNNDIEYTRTIWSDGTISADKRNSACIIRYINPDEYQNYKLDLDEINYSDLLKENTIIISKRLANSLNVKTGDKIKLQALESNESNQYEIVDIIADDGEESRDMNIYGYVFINIDELGLTSDYDLIASKIYIKNINNDKSVNKSIEENFSGEKIQFVGEEANILAKELEGASTVYDSMGILAIVVSFVGIISSSILMIMKRQKDICLLKVFGANNKNIFFLFLGEMLFTTFLGVLSGLAIGSILSYIVCYFVFEMFYNIFMINGVLVAYLKVFAIGMSAGVIFGIIPVMLTMQFKPITVLRDTVSKNMKNGFRLFVSGMIITILLSGMFSIYLESLNGFLVVIMLIIFVAILYSISKIFLRICTLSISRKRGVKKIALKSMMKDSEKFSLVIMTTSISVAVVGMVLLMYNSILPSLEKQVQGSLGYNAMFRVNISNEEEVNNVLKEADIKDFYISSIVDFNIVKVNGETIEQLDSYDYSIDCIHENMGYVNDNLFTGDRLDANSDSNDIVLDEEFYYQYEMSVGDVITIEIENQEYNFNVVGVRSTDKIKTGQAYINYEAIKNTVECRYIRYYIIADNVEEFISYINSKFNDIVVLNISDISQPYAQTLNKEMMLLKIISVLCISSSILLIFNILSITYMGKQKEFLILGMYGAEKKWKRKMIIIQGLRLGIASSILAFLLSIIGALLMEGMIGISINYDLITVVEVALLAIGCSLLSVLGISSNVINYNRYNVLRTE